MPGETTRVMRAGPSGSFEGVRTAAVDGIALAYREQGEGEAVVFVHGSASDLRTWDQQLPAIGTRYRAIAYSRRFARPNEDIEPCADDQAVAADHLEQLGDVEAGATTHVEHAVAGPGVERSADQLAPAQHIARRVELLQPLDETPIELQLAHGPTLPAPARWSTLPSHGENS